jgi:hypothetical protein
MLEPKSRIKRVPSRIKTKLIAEQPKRLSKNGHHSKFSEDAESRKRISDDDSLNGLLGTKVPAV